MKGRIIIKIIKQTKNLAIITKSRRRTNKPKSCKSKKTTEKQKQYNIKQKAHTLILCISANVSENSYFVTITFGGFIENENPNFRKIILTQFKNFIKRLQRILLKENKVLRYKAALCKSNSQNNEKANHFHVFIFNADLKQIEEALETGKTNLISSYNIIKLYGKGEAYESIAYYIANQAERILPSKGLRIHAEYEVENTINFFENNKVVHKFDRGILNGKGYLTTNKDDKETTYKKILETDKNDKSEVNITKVRLDKKKEFIEIDNNTEEDIEVVLDWED